MMINRRGFLSGLMSSVAVAPIAVVPVMEVATVASIMPLPAPLMADGYMNLMAYAISSINNVTGVNLEMIEQHHGSC